jgi:glycerol-3-phosphate cytidylyltransferase-like family protein
MQPKSIPPGPKAADDKRRRVIRRIQPVAQAGDESKQSCAVARFQTMKLSLVVSGYTIRDDPGGRAQFDSEIDDLMANIRRHAGAPVPNVGLSSLAEAPAA